jgi:hypothetical protein
MQCASAATRSGAFLSLLLAPRMVLPSIAITRWLSAAGPGTQPGAQHRLSTSTLTSANASRKVDSSAGPRAALSTARISGPTAAAHCPLTALAGPRRGELRLR